MVVRHKINRGWKLVAAFLAGSLATTLPGGTILAQESSKFELPVSKRPPLGTTGKAHSSLTSAIEAQRKGDYEAAAKSFRDAQVLQADLTPNERTELTRLMQANQEALRQRKEAESSLAAIETMVNKGQVSSASDLLRRLEANEQYFSPAAKQKFASLQERINSGKATAKAGSGEIRGSDSAAKARALISEGRTLTMSGKFEAAEQKIREAESLRVNFAASEDTPSKLRDDIQKSRNDARFLLTAGQQALADGDFELAEKLAKASDRAAGPLTFRFALDNPTKLQKDILEAKASRGTARNTVRPATPNSVSGIVQTSAETVVANPESESHCRSLIKDARSAMQKGDMTTARQMAEKARATRANLAWWEDTPERVLAEITRADAAKSAVNDAGASKLSPTEQLKTARMMFTQGKLDEATEMVMKLKANSTARWGLFDDNPDRLRGEIEKALNKRNQDESVKVLAEARKLYDAGEYEKATRAAYRAQQLHGPYSIWEMGDRPQKLIAEIESSRLRRKVTNKLDSAIVQSTNKVEEKVNSATSKADQTIKKTMDKATDTVQKANDSADRTITQLQGAAQSVGSKIDNAVATAEGTVTGMVGIPPLPGAKDTGETSVPALLADARKLQAAGKLTEARAKAIQAQRMGGSVPLGVATPEEVLSDLNRQAAKQVANSLEKVTDLASKDSPDAFSSAKVELDKARQIAREFGFDQSSIDAKAKWLTNASGPSTNTLAKDTLPGGPLGIPPLPGTGSNPKELTPPLPVGAIADGSNPGKALLEKARTELKSGQTSNARRLAEEAFQGPYGVRDEASALLRTLDTEDSNQKGLEAKRTFDAGVAAYNRKEFSQALALFSTVQDKFLDKDRASRKKELLQSPSLQGLVRSDSEKPGMGIGNAIAKVKQGTEAPAPSDLDVPPAPGGANKSGTDLVEAAQAIKEVKFSQLRQQGLEAQREAAEKFRVGQSDAALEILQDHLAQLNEAQLDASKVALLKRPVESRLQHFKLLKAQKEFLEKDNVVRDSRKSSISQKQLAEENKQKKVSEQMKLFNTSFKEGKYLEAESYAMRAHELDPENSMAAAAVSMAKMQRNVSVAKSNKSEKEKFFLEGLNDAEKVGSLLTVDKPLDGGADSAADRRNKRTASLTTLANPQRKTAADREIESRLNTPVNINFKDSTLREALEDLRKYYNINIVPDVAALEEEGISLDRPVTLMLEQVSLKSALNLMLRSAHLTYVIKDEVLLITTESQARGKLVTVTYQVTDLITPLENFGTTKPGQSLTNRGMTKQTMTGAGAGNNPTPIQSPFSLSGGQPTGSPSGGALQNSDGQNVVVSKKGGQTTEDTLIKLITATINPQSWNTVGGPGSIEFFPLTNSLVINQTPDIQEQVQDLLNNLRRLLDQEVAIEIRFISIAEDFYERIGVNFNMNIKTDRNTSRFEPQITSNTYKPAGYINDPNMKGLVGGLTPAGTFTTDLDIPVSQSSFGLTNPVFGGYPGLPGSGGINLGLAFLSDIQVFLFLEAAQGDNRTNVMQAPKITMFNGQTSALGVFDSQFFLTDVGVTPLANGNITFTPIVTEQPIGFQMSLQAIISADRRVVRLTPSIQLTNLVPGPVQLFPIVVPIFPQTGNLVNPNPSDPITFTQFIQQPIINTLFVQTTVAVPDGGTVLMGGFKRLSESRSEYGPPVLSKIPYLNRLFRNTGYGRETQSLLMMVTPRIIIQEEEEMNQTGVKVPFPNNP